jgi:quercetin dioxygenase-like cupin family protein
MQSTIWLIFTFLFSSISGQDPIAVNPTIASVEFENDRIRVLRVSFRPHDALAMHSHPALVVVGLTPNSRRITLPDGTKKDFKADTGDVSWREPGRHAVENLGEAFENIEIEFKKASAPAVPVSPSNTRVSETSSRAAIPVEQEPHHHVLLENQYVRVLDVQIPPGDCLLFHTHSYDNLSVRISGGLVQNQMQGSEWPAATEVKPGAVVFAEAANKPYTHRVRNLGPSTYHVVDVELLQ